MITYTNPFNEVLLAIKKQCGDTYVIQGSACFDAVALESKVSVDRLSIYLDSLQALQLITYSKASRFIKITALGREKKELFVA